MGKRLAQWPIDPQFARVLMAAEQLIACLKSLSLFALSIQDPEASSR